jgi:hypothetical protein
MAADFDDFFLKEYERISEAYFSTMNSISQFMKHYLVVASLPIAFLAFLVRPQDAHGPVDFLQHHPDVVLVALLSISAIGYCLSVYLMGLHFDAILYARTVNGVRQHFFSRATDDEAKIEHRRVLPIDPAVPSYYKGYFLAVVFAFALTNGTYALAAVYIYCQLRGWVLTTGWFVPIGVVVLHVVSYYVLGVYEERGRTVGTAGITIKRPTSLPGSPTSGLGGRIS